MSHKKPPLKVNIESLAQYVVSVSPYTLFREMSSIEREQYKDGHSDLSTKVSFEKIADEIGNKNILADDLRYAYTENVIEGFPLYNEIGKLLLIEYLLKLPLEALRLMSIAALTAIAGFSLKEMVKAEKAIVAALTGGVIVWYEVKGTVKEYHEISYRIYFEEINTVCIYSASGNFIDTQYPTETDVKHIFKNKDNELLSNYI